MTNTNPWRLFRLLKLRSVTVFCMMLFLLSVSLFSAEDNSRKVVRVPCTDFERQMVLDEHNRPVSGYAYEYIQTIGAYAGWDIEYVYCDSFSSSVEALLAGEVDLMYDISFTEERAKEILFPDEPMAKEYYYLYASDQNASITPGNLTTLNGKTVGVTIGTLQIQSKL